MTAFIPISEDSDNFSLYKQSFNRVFLPPQSLDHPSDVTLVVQDGKEFKAHKDVLSEASPFFEKLLNSNMKESKEGVVRLEMFSEPVMAATLEFIYTGSVQIMTQEMAQGLIVMADYLFLSNLRTLAVRAAEKLQTLNTSNCISIYYFAEIYQCQELLSQARKFILENFTAASKTEEFLNMSNEKVEMWISSDEINISAEEDVFEIILAWINGDRSEREKYFAELFCQVRLNYVTPDYLRSYVLTNDLVTDNDGCLNLVKEAMKLSDSYNYYCLSAWPRKSLETAIIIVSVNEHILGYSPREDTWCTMSVHPRYKVFSNPQLVPCHGKLYSAHYPCSRQWLSYDPFSSIWTLLPFTDSRNVKQIFVGNENEMYAFMSTPFRFVKNGPCDFRRYITKYNPETNSWEDIISFNYEKTSLFESLYFIEDMCIVAKGSFIYFIGGWEVIRHTFLKDVYRYDLTGQKLEKLADLHIDKATCGASAHGKIFVTGKIKRNGNWSHTCEVYDETTNEWQLIAGWKMPPGKRLNILSVFSVAHKLYALVLYAQVSDLLRVKIECYDLDKDEWNEVTEIPIYVNATKARSHPATPVVSRYACSMKVFKGLLSSTNVPKEPSFFRPYPLCRRKCLIL